jgi:hypothetical protein
MSKHATDSPTSQTHREIISRAKRLSTKGRRARERAEPRPSYPDLKLSIEHVPIGSVRAYGRRLRKSSKAHQEKLEASIGAFGVVLPFLVNDDGVLIDGHALFDAVKALGYSEVPVVRTTHLGEAHIKALRLALNRLPELNTRKRRCRRPSLIVPVQRPCSRNPGRAGSSRGRPSCVRAKP